MKHNVVGLLESYTCIKNENEIVLFTKYGDWIRIDIETGNAKVMESISDYQSSPFMIFGIKGEFYRLDSGDNTLYKKGSGEWIKFDGNNTSSEIISLAGQIEDKIYVLYANGDLYYNIDVEKKTYDHAVLFSGDQVRPIAENDGYIYMQEGNKVLISYNILLSTEKKYTLEDYVGIIQHICVMNNKDLLILNNKNQIFRFNCDALCEKICELGNEDVMHWGRIHCINNEIVILPWRDSKQIYTYNPETEILETEDIPSYVNFWEGGLFKFVRYYEDKSDIVYPCRAANCLLIISKRDRKLTWLKLDVEENIRWIKSIINKSKYFVLKEDTISLEDYIYIIEQQ